jgi:hypothetical protein
MTLQDAIDKITIFSDYRNYNVANFFELSAPQPISNLKYNKMCCYLQNEIKNHPYNLFVNKEIEKFLDDETETIKCFHNNIYIDK